ncbi:MAG: ABC transporter ATP-binding protein [Chloroflexi bacterium]|nr:ABC transporter ATP-binding protein [Chloroflexota bacterium]
MDTSEYMVEISHLCKYFELKGGLTLKAVDNVTFKIKRGEIMGLVGESGCGKTTLGRTIKLLYLPTSGTIKFNGEEVKPKDKIYMKEFTRNAQMIFQDPYSSLDPRMTVAEIISEGMEIHNMYSAKERRNRVIELLRLVGLGHEHANRFPSEFSGGQRQRVGIARTLAVNPQFIVCDEPISALDVSIQAQIVNLFKDLRQRLNLTYLFIAHDLSMVKYISDKVAVMYLGKIVEISNSKEIYRNPLHPYTEFLLSSIPIPNPRTEANREHIVAGDEMPSPINLPKGCSFQPRCRYAFDDCLNSSPELIEIEPGHFAACFKAENRKSST